MPEGAKFRNTPSACGGDHLLNRKSFFALRNPYPAGERDIVKEGAYADLLLVDGNPLENLSAVTDKKNLKIIMKDGVIYKNTLN